MKKFNEEELDLIWFACTKTVVGMFLILALFTLAESYGEAMYLFIMFHPIYLSARWVISGKLWRGWYIFYIVLILLPITKLHDHRDHLFPKLHKEITGYDARNFQSYDDNDNTFEKIKEIKDIHYPRDNNGKVYYSRNTFIKYKNMFNNRLRNTNIYIQDNEIDVKTIRNGPADMFHEWNHIEKMKTILFYKFRQSNPRLQEYIDVQFDIYKNEGRYVGTEYQYPKAEDILDYMNKHYWIGVNFVNDAKPYKVYFNEQNKTSFPIYTDKKSYYRMKDEENRKGQ